jgi:hypothetical protein
MRWWRLYETAAAGGTCNGQGESTWARARNDAGRAEQTAQELATTQAGRALRRAGASNGTGGCGARGTSAGRTPCCKCYRFLKQYHKKYAYTTGIDIKYDQYS